MIPDPPEFSSPWFTSAPNPSPRKRPDPLNPTSPSSAAKKSKPNSPERDPCSPELEPTSSSVDHNPAKESRPNSPVWDSSSLSRLGLTPADLLLTPQERAEKVWKAFFAKRDADPNRVEGFRKIDLPETLPKGCAWGSYVPGSGKRQFVYTISCLNCGMGGAHVTDECPYKNTLEAEEFRKENLTVRMLPAKSKNK